METIEVRLLWFMCSECGWENIAANKHKCPDCGCLVTAGADVTTVEVPEKNARAVRESDL